MRLLWLLLPLISQSTSSLFEFAVPSIIHHAITRSFDGYKPYHYDNPLHSQEAIKNHSSEYKETKLAREERIKIINANIPDEMEMSRQDFIMLHDDVSNRRFLGQQSTFNYQFLFFRIHQLRHHLDEEHPYSLEIDYVNEYRMVDRCDIEKQSLIHDSENFVHKDWRGNNIFNRFIYECESTLTCEQFLTWPDDFQGLEIKEWENTVMKGFTDSTHVIIAKKWRTFSVCGWNEYPEFYDRLRKLGFDEDLLTDPTPSQMLALRRVAQYPLMAWRKAVPLPESRRADGEKMWAQLNEREMKNYEYTYMLTSGSFKLLKPM